MELSIEEKAQRYDETVNKLRRFMEQGVDPLITRADVQDYFPELKVNEDERIKKEIISFITTTPKARTSHKKWIAWLEKQGEQKSAEIYPIFRVYDYIRNKRTGDKVLIEQLDIKSKVYCYFSNDGAAEIYSDFSFFEQNDWELIGQNMVEQNSAWSEEDENHFKSILSTIECCKVQFPNAQAVVEAYNADTKWLKSLKERYTWKPSDEQIDAISKIRKYFRMLNAYGETIDNLIELEEQLKKLKG